MQRVSYSDHVRPSMKMDTWNELRNAPLFGYDIFPDAALNVVEQDINKFEARYVSEPSQVGPQNSQKPKYRYKLYDKKDFKPLIQTSAQPQQPWRQFVSRGHGCGSTSCCFSKYAWRWQEF